ncbi:hypothetical protein WMY93_016282 [Mugilogobius chulae]|uniref:Immunoglobulin domain-containing protein n=1 Tax=Mugilogobius chulae TaxID=88201 RepID=A0AAW0NT28_9GOBI
MDIIDVRISNLTLNDSGRYSCFWQEPSGLRIYHEFMAEVTDGDLTPAITAAAGKDFRLSCSFSTSGNKKRFCRNTCSKKNMLVETTGDRGRRGRYRVEYSEHADDLSYVDVTIKAVSQSDSGVYQCYLDTSSKTFRLDVLAPPTSSGLLILTTLACVVLITMTTILIICCRRHDDERKHLCETNMPKKKEKAERGQTHFYGTVVNLYEMCPPTEDTYQDLPPQQELKQN